MNNGVWKFLGVLDDGPRERVDVIMDIEAWQAAWERQLKSSDGLIATGNACSDGRNELQESACDVQR